MQRSEMESLIVTAQNAMTFKALLKINAIKEMEHNNHSQQHVLNLYLNPT